LSCFDAAVAARADSAAGATVARGIIIAVEKLLGNLRFSKAVRAADQAGTALGQSLMQAKGLPLLAAAAGAPALGKRAPKASRPSRAKRKT
jgi:hypothetical protein